LTVDVEELKARMASHGYYLEELLIRVSEQARDIKKCQDALDELEEDISSEE